MVFPTSALPLFERLHAGSAKTFNKIASSKPGRFALGVAQTMTTNIINEIQKGTNIRKIKWEEEFFYATISNCLSFGMDRKATELLEWLKESNNKMFTSLNRLQRNLEEGKNDSRIKSDINRVLINWDDAIKKSLLYGKETTKNRALSSGITSGLRNELDKIGDDD